MNKLNFNLNTFYSDFDQKLFLQELVLSQFDRISKVCGTVAEKCQNCEDCEECGNFEYEYREK